MRKKRGAYQIKRSSKTKKSRLRIVIYGGLFFCLILGLVYFFIFSPILWVGKIEVKGVKSVSALEVENIIQNVLSEKLFEVVPLNSVILVPVHKIRANVLETFPKIAEVEINKKFVLSSLSDLKSSKDNILEIKIKEREPFGVWCRTDKIPIFDKNENSGIIETSTPKEIIEKEENNQCFYFDKEGIIYKESPIMDGGLILVVNDLRRRDFHLKQEVVSKRLINFISFIKEELTETLGLRPISFNVVSVQDLRILISHGWQIYFDPQGLADKQMEVLKRVLKEEIKEGQENLEYVDLRIENRAYYK